MMRLLHGFFSKYVCATFPASLQVPSAALTVLGCAGVSLTLKYCVGM